jgi:hypothetical protein
MPVILKLERSARLDASFPERSSLRVTLALPRALNLNTTLAIDSGMSSGVWTIAAQLAAVGSAMAVSGLDFASGAGVNVV